MSTDERARVVAELPAAMTEQELEPPEGDPHFSAKKDTLDMLRAYFDREGRSVYVAAELTVYYPAERRFSPDVLAVVDVPTHARMKWAVSAEGRGLDWVLEIIVAGDRTKDLEANVARYAALGIPEYFVFDRERDRLHGFRLEDPGARVYRSIVAQAGRYSSRILGLDLVVENRELRFYRGTAELLRPRELVARLEAALDHATRAAEERAKEAEQREKELDEARARIDALLAELAKK